ncbi:MAG: AraC family transcriptional regulator [Lachnospiraceae bacterium]|nr:AraC family transcriptional regulator [Lachnospiraceae bacterium]
MIKQTDSVKMDVEYCEYGSHQTDGIPYAVYYAYIQNYIDHYIPLHWHNEIEAGFVIKGKVRVFLGDEEIILSKGEGYFINANQFHGFYQLEDEAQFGTVLFDPMFVSGESGRKALYQKYLLPLISNKQFRYMKLYQHILWQQECINILRSIYEDAKKEPYGYELLMRNKMTDLICTINGHIHDNTISAHSYNIDPEFHKMVDFITRNYSHELTIKEIAGSAGLSERDCYRKFKRNANITPLKYLNAIRVKTAMELLLKTDDSITAIGFDVGFQSSSYFCSIFKKATNMTPNEYRSMHEGMYDDR